MKTRPTRREIFLSIFWLLCMSAAFPAFAAEPQILYLFWGDGCPHCEEEKMFFDVLQQEVAAYLEGK